MDIRNFFGKKSSAQTGKPKPDLKTDAKLLPSPAVSSKLQSQAPSQTASRARVRDPPKKKTKVIIDDTDDSDATDWLEGESLPPRTVKSPGRNPKVVDSAVDTVPPRKMKSPLKRNLASSTAATSDSPKKKSRSTVEEGIIGVNSDDMKTKTAPKDSRRSRTIVSIALDDDSTEENERASTKIHPSNRRLKSTSRPVDHVDSDEDFNDENPDTPKENSHPKKRKAPSSTKSTTPTNKTPTKSTSKQAVSAKKELLLEPTVELASFDSLNAAPECLSGLTFVFSGILDNLGREESVDYVKELGGRVTTAVSSKTSYLVVGDRLEDGRPFSEGSKYKKAVEIGVKVIHGEGRFYGLCKLFSDKIKGLKSGESAVVAPTPTASARAPEVVAPAPATRINPYAKKTNPYAKTNPPATQTALNPYASKNSTISVPLMENKSAGDPNALWADKYAPTTTADILGNQDSVKKLKTWLSRWEHTFNNDKAHGKAFSSPNGPWKAALLSGPPGIGKTTTATLCAKEDNRDVLEMNASDARSKKTLTVALGDVTGSQVLSFGTKRSTSTNATKKRCLIMDEVDGMGAGDRGGMAELIGIIKNSRVPIICICNDRQSQKIKSLLPYCLDLRYKRPVKTVIARRVMRVGEMEGMKIEQNAVEAIAESCGNDIRQVLNCLQMWSSSKAGRNSLTYRDLKERESSINKDAILRVSMFDATKQIIEGRRGLSGSDRKAAKDSLYKRSDAFFVDYSLIGINVHQNYLKVMVGGYQEAVRSKDDAKMDAFVDRMHESTLAMSDFAVGEQAVRGGDMNWSLLPFLSMMTVKTGYHAGGENGGFLGGFPEFAGWMGKNSTRGKKSRLLNELGYHMNYKVSTDKADLRLYYLPVLRARFMALLADGDKAKITEAISLMDEYGLDRNDVFENIDEFKIDSKAKGLNDIDSKQKAAFTREYNQGSHKSQALVHEQGAGKVSKASKSTASLGPASLDAVDDDKVEESDDEEEELTEEKLKELFGKKTRKSSAKSVKGKSK